MTKLDTAFSEIDKSLIATNNNFKNTERLFQNYLTEVFKRSSEDWKNYSIKQLGKVVTGNTPKTSIVENYGDFISFVKPGDFKTDGSIDFEKQKLSKIGASKSRIVGKNLYYGLHRCNNWKMWLYRHRYCHQPANKFNHARI